MYIAQTDANRTDANIEFVLSKVEVEALPMSDIISFLSNLDLFLHKINFT
jgi:hypothetical protein